LLQNAASGGVRERAERGIEVGLAILSHMVQYITWVMECNRRLSARCVAPVSEEAAEADAHKAARQSVEQEPPQKF
jgi:hypothetical protein